MCWTSSHSLWTAPPSCEDASIWYAQTAPHMSLADQQGEDMQWQLHCHTNSSEPFDTWIPPICLDTCMQSQHDLHQPWMASCILYSQCRTPIHNNDLRCNCIIAALNGTNNRCTASSAVVSQTTCNGLKTHLLQNASVPKLRSITPSNCLAFGRRKGTWPTPKFFM